MTSRAHRAEKVHLGIGVKPLCEPLSMYRNIQIFLTDQHASVTCLRCLTKIKGGKFKIPVITDPSTVPAEASDSSV